MPRRKKLSEEIRDLLLSSGKTQMSICQAIGVPQPNMSGFMTGRRGMSLDVLDRLADHLDWHLVVGKPKKRS